MKIDSEIANVRMVGTSNLFEIISYFWFSLTKIYYAAMDPKGFIREQSGLPNLVMLVTRRIRPEVSF